MLNHRVYAGYYLHLAEARNVNAPHGLVLSQEIFGVNPHIQAVARHEGVTPKKIGN